MGDKGSGLVEELAQTVFRTLQGFGVSKSEICFVGGVVLEVHGLREANDIDVAVPSRQYERLLSMVSESQIVDDEDRIEFSADGTKHTKLDIKRNIYGSLPITDDDLFSRPELTDILNGTRVARAELEFGRNVLDKNPSSDRWVNDRILLERWALEDRKWRWDLIPVIRSNDASTGKKPTSVLRRIGRMSTLMKKIPRGIRNPRLASRKVFRRVLSLIMKHLRNKRAAFLPPTLLCSSKMDVGTLLQLQFQGTEFCRYDTLLRLLTIERYICGYDYPFEEYEQMQNLRVGRFTRLQFEELINTVQQNGYAENRYPILIDRKGRIKDGSHRLSLALAFHVEEIPIEFVVGSGPTNYDRRWFEEREFEGSTLYEVDALLQRELIRTGAVFQMVLWPPAQSVTTDIEQEIRKHYVILTKKTEVVHDLHTFVHKIYQSDDIARWKIEKKVYHMQGYEPRVSVFSFLIPDPKYRKKAISDSYLSTEVERLKNKLRERYKHHIDNYVYDIILHIGDNPAHNRRMVEAVDECMGSEMSL